MNSILAYLSVHILYIICLAFEKLVLRFILHNFFQSHYWSVLNQFFPLWMLKFFICFIDLHFNKFEFFNIKIIFMNVIECLTLVFRYWLWRTLIKDFWLKWTTKMLFFSDNLSTNQLIWWPGINHQCFLIINSILGFKSSKCMIFTLTHVCSTQ